MGISQAEGSGLRTVHLFAQTPVSRVLYNGGKQQVQTSVLVHCLGLCHTHTWVTMYGPDN